MEIFQDRSNPDDTIKDKIAIIASTVVQLEREKERFAATWEGIKASFTFPRDFNELRGVLDETLSTTVPMLGLSGMKIGSVDGSILRECMLGVDLIASKARGVVFRFYSKRPPVVRYFPQEPNENFNLLGVFQGANLQEIDAYANAERLLCELELVRKILQQEPALDMMIIDGTLHIPDLFKTTDNHAIQAQIKRITELLIDIINASEANHTLLVGVTKDSSRADHLNVLRALIPARLQEDERFRAFMEMDTKQMFAVFKDYDFFYRILQEGERGFAIRSVPRVSDGPGKPRTMFEKFLHVKGLALHSYLLKAAQMDVPLKIELFASPETARPRVVRSSSLLRPMSRIMIDYSEPSPQVEAHKRVKISEQDFSIIVDMVRQQAGYCTSVMQQRRNRRPI